MSRPEPTDLLCQLRRAAGGPEAEPRLTNLLASSPEARLVHLALGEFERESQVRAGDEVLLAAISERALREATERSSGELQVSRPARSLRSRRASVRGRVRLALAVAAAIVMMCGAAYGLRAVGGLLRSGLGGAPSAAPSAGHPTGLRRAAPLHSSRTLRDNHPAPALPAPETTPPTDSSVNPEAPPAPPARSAPRAGPAPAVVPPRSRAAALFSEANAARRAGREQDAATLYQQLLLTHPGAREAPPSRLALAKLLRGRDPGAALAHFEALARAATPLRAEALWGIASSARALGQRAKEKQALLELLREFPTSPYAAASSNAVGR